MAKITNRVTELLALALLLLQNVRCKSDTVERSLATSVVGMEFLLEKESQLLSAMESYGNKLENKLNIIRRATTEMWTEILKSQNNPEEYLSNPINSYALIRRLHQDWGKWKLFLHSSVGADEINKMKKLLVDKPTSFDLVEATEAIYRLNSVYDVNPAYMAAGLLNGKQYDARFSAIDCFQIGSLLFQQDRYSISGAWLNTSLQLYQDSDINDILEFDKTQILKLYDEVLKQDHLSSVRTPTETESETMEQILKKEDEKDINDLKQICHLNYPSKLHCLYNKTTSAFLQLAPLKMEILHLDPYVILYHDVVSDNEIAVLKNQAENKIARAQTYEGIQDGFYVSNKRTVKSAWFYDSNNVIERLHQRITDMSGFDLWDSELMQIMNYGMGGQYVLHRDYINGTEAFEYSMAPGDRIATVLFYLSDVEQGGATVFPFIHVSVTPKKGNALMWYNLDNKMEADERTMHAACPVIVGSKWVFTKWIRQYSQMFLRRCTT